MSVIIDTPVQRDPYDRGYGRDRHPTEGTAIELQSNEEFLDAVLGNPKRQLHVSRDKRHIVNMPRTHEYGDKAVFNDAECEVPTVSLAVQAVHQAFASHKSLSLRPDTLWYFIVHEVAEYVRQNSDVCASLFTDTPEAKQTIEVRDDSLSYVGPSDWGRSINLIREPLAQKVSDRTMELFLPRFSTSTFEDETALLVALMDAASPYYEYRWMTMCGIPQIRLEGNGEDFAALHERTERLASEFGGLKDYFTDLLPVLEQIANTASGSTPSDSFWRSIYKFGGGSGGPYVSGWISAFFAYVQTDSTPEFKSRFDWRNSHGFKTNNFPSHVTKVPFVWNYLGTEYDMAFVAGVLGVDSEDDFLIPRLGYGVIEV